jgi:hypothetical protein
MKNRLSDLTDHLFAAIERMGDEELSDEALDRELKRTHGIVEASDSVISAATLVLKAKVAVTESLGGNVKLPSIFLTE